MTHDGRSKLGAVAAAAASRIFSSLMHCDISGKLGKLLNRSGSTDAELAAVNAGGEADYRGHVAASKMATRHAQVGAALKCDSESIYTSISKRKCKNLRLRRLCVCGQEARAPRAIQEARLAKKQLVQCSSSCSLSNHVN